MRKFTLLILAAGMCLSASAQSKYARVAKQAIQAKIVKENPVGSQAGNPVANTKAVLDNTIGDSEYDLQTNGSIGQRLKLYPDGSMAGVWTRGFESAGRGTGYNYYDGTAWGPIPTARIENDRTGWPSYAQLGANGEIVIAHLNDGLKISTRATRGQGTWNQAVLMGPAGATDISWPSIITNGPNNNYIHMIASTYTAYQGLDLALLYYRSLDGGATWDKTHVILPQMTSADYDGFNGDEYVWGTPHGDTIYFVVSGPWVDTFIMQSNDNGETWTKIPILSNANKKLPTGTTDVASFTMSDGSAACEMDHNGIIHVAFGIGGGYMSGSTKYIYYNRNGLVYWNTTMAMIQDSLDLDTLDAHGQLLGYSSNGPGPGDTLIAVPNYRVGLSSFPQISIDEYNNKYFFWSVATPGNPSPDPYNYRHLNGRAWFHDKATWGEIIDFNADISFIFTEYVYPCVAKRIMNDKIELTYQTSSQPGSNIISSTISLHQVNIDHREIPGSAFWPTGIGKQETAKTFVSQNFPNPASGLTRVRISMVQSAPVNVTIATLQGVTIRDINQGLMNAGSHDITIDASAFTPGVYMLTVNIGGEKTTRKMIVE